MKRILFTIFLMFLSIFQGCAAQRELTLLDKRLTELELRDAEARKHIKQMESQVTTYGRASENKDQQLRRQSASLHALIEGLREEIRILNGRLEIIEYALNQQKKVVAGIQKHGEITSTQLTDDIRKNAQRIAGLENYLNSVSIGKTTMGGPKIISGTQAREPKELSEIDIYKLGQQAFDQGDWEIAKKRFQEIIELYPKSENSYNAQFLIGEIYYREKWFEKAILEYQKVIEKYPKCKKAPTALLKQGLAFQKIGDIATSRLILEELVNKYSDSSEAKVAKEKLKQFKHPSDAIPKAKKQLSENHG